MARQAAFLGGELQGFFAVEFGLADEFFDAVGETLRGVCLCARVGGSFGTNQKRYFAARGAFFERSGEFGEFAAAELFVHLRHFTRDASAAIAKHFARISDALSDAVWRFVKNDSAVFDAQAFEGAAALTAAGRQKADEEKFFAGQSRSGKGSEQSGWARNWHHGNVVPQAKRNKAVAGIGNERHARVAHESDFRALLQRHDELRRARQLIVFVVADQRLVNVVVREQLLRVARVFAGDLIDFFQDAQGAKRDVLQIADGRPDEVKAAASGIRGAWRFGGRKLRDHAEKSSMQSMRGRKRQTGMLALQKRGSKHGSSRPATTKSRTALARERRLRLALAAREECYTFSFEQRIGGASVPLYEYKCLKCGRNTEKIENVSGPHLKKCPHCGGKVEPVITAPAIQFKGAGWYVTDYGGKKTADGDKADKPATETKETANKEKDPGTKETAAKESSSKEGKDKKPAKKK